MTLFLRNNTMQLFTNALNFRIYVLLLWIFLFEFNGSIFINGLPAKRKSKIRADPARRCFGIIYLREL